MPEPMGLLGGLTAEPKPQPEIKDTNPFADLLGSIAPREEQYLNKPTESDLAPNKGAFAGLLNSIGNPAWTSEGLPIGQRVHSFLESHAHEQVPWDEMKDKVKETFPQVKADELEGSYKNIAALNQERENFKDATEKPLEYLKRHSVPFASANQRAQLTQNYKGAVGRYNAGSPSPTDLKDIAAYERLQEIERKQGIGGQALDAVLSIPAIAGEAAMTGTALRLAGRGANAVSRLGSYGIEAAPRAAATGLAGIEARLASAIYRAPATTAGMPAMWLDRAAQNTLQNGGIPADLKNLGPAAALGVLQVAVLEGVGGAAGAVEGKGVVPFLKRVGEGTKVGVGGQQLVDIYASAMGLETGYGVLGDVARGDYGQALQHATVQAITMAGFSLLHAGGKKEAAKPFVDAVQSSLKDSAKAGLPPEQAAAKAEADLQAEFAKQHSIDIDKVKGLLAETQRPPGEKILSPLVITDGYGNPVDRSGAPGKIEPMQPVEKTPRQKSTEAEGRHKELDNRLNDAFNRERVLQNEVSAGLPKQAELDAAKAERIDLGKKLKQAAKDMDAAHVEVMKAEAPAKTAEPAPEPETPVEPPKVEPAQVPPQGENAPPAATGERRQDTARRQTVAEMSPEEMRKTLLTSPTVDLPNRRAFDEAPKSPVVGFSDADGLKAFNDRFGYEAGDALLRAKADALKAAGVDAYHEKGDEFLHRGESEQELRAKMDRAREILRDSTIEVTLKDGTVKRYKGADFSYGVGHDLPAAESGLKEHKSQREARGERARGELRGIAEVGAEPGTERTGGIGPERGAETARHSAEDVTPTPFDALRERVQSGEDVGLDEVFKAAKLTDREQHVLRERLPKPDGTTRSHEDIAADKELGTRTLSRQRVKQIEQEALDKLGLQGKSIAASVHQVEQADRALDMIEKGELTRPEDMRAVDPEVARRRDKLRDTVEAKLDNDLDALTDRILKGEISGPEAEAEFARINQASQKRPRNTKAKKEGTPPPVAERSPVEPAPVRSEDPGRVLEEPARPAAPGEGTAGEAPAADAEGQAASAAGEAARNQLTPEQRMRRGRSFAKEGEQRARDFGVEQPEQIHDVAEAVYKQHQESIAESNDMVRQTEDMLRRKGRRLSLKNVDEPESLPGWDEILDYWKNRNPYTDSDTLFQQLKLGQEKFTYEQAYTDAVDQMLAEQQRARDTATPKTVAPDAGDFDFGANVQRAVGDFMTDEGGAVNLKVLAEKAKAAGEHIKRVWTEAVNQVKELAGVSYPRTTAHSRVTGEKLSQLDAAGKYVRAATPDYIDRVLGPEASDPKADLLRGTVLAEFRLRTAKAQRLAESARASGEAAKARAAGDMPAAAEWAKKATENMIAARKIKGTFVGQIAEGETKPTLATEADYYRELASKEQQAFHQRWKTDFVDKEMEPNYKRARGMEDVEPIESLTQIPGLPVNFKAVAVEGDVKAGVTFLSGGSRGNLKNVKTGKYVFAREAGLDAEAYDTRVSSMIENSLQKGYPNARKADFFRMAKAEGVMTNKATEGYKELELANWPENTPDVTKGDKVYVREDSYDEIRRTLKLDQPTRLGLGVTATAEALTRVTLAAQITEAAAHIGNQITQLFNPRMNLFRYGKNAWNLFWGDPATRAKFVELARIGATKEGGFEATDMFRGSKWNPLTWIGRAIDVSDKAMRLTASDAFDSLVEGRSRLNPLRYVLGKGEGVENTETARRDFINQIGNYSRQAQAKIVAVLRDTGLAPFATAGSNYWMQGQRALTFAPGVEGKTYLHGAELRAEKFLRIAGVFTGVALTNYLLWGKVNGDDNTPTGSIKLGVDKEGKTRYFDLLSFTGWTRGMRQIGAQAFMNGDIKDTDKTKTMNNAVDDAWRGLLSPIAGPLVRFAYTAKTGEDLIGRKLVKPDEGGQVHAGDKWLAALKNINPSAAAVLGADTPGKDVDAIERFNKMLGRFGIKAGGGHEVEIENFYDRWKQAEFQHAAWNKQARMGLATAPPSVEYRILQPYHARIAQLNQFLKGEQPGGRGVPPEPAVRDRIRKEMVELSKMAMEQAKKR